MKRLFLIVCLVGLLSAFGGVAYPCDKDKLTALEERLTAQDEKLTDLMKQLQLQNEEIETVKKTAMPRHEVEENQIAFSVASHDYFGPVSIDTNIPFPVVYTNVGGAWNPGTNAFQATKAGFYLFTASFRGEASGIVDGAIVHTTGSGSERLASLFSPPSQQTGDANAAIFQVAVGDFVSVQQTTSPGQIGSNSAHTYSTFSGYFLFP